MDCNPIPRYTVSDTGLSTTAKDSHGRFRFGLSSDVYAKLRLRTPAECGTSHASRYLRLECVLGQASLHCQCFLGSHYCSRSRILCSSECYSYRCSDVRARGGDTSGLISLLRLLQVFAWESFFCV